MLTPKQKAFADYYIECGNAAEAYRKAGYKNYKSAAVEASKTLKNPKISQYIEERQKQIEDRRIASAAEIMQYLTSVMRGEVKDQFGLDAPLAERTKAAVELAKRKVDVAQNTDTGGIVIVNNIPRPGKE
ncbi:phage terminase small subunit [Clostridium sp. CAG:58]|nr:phage terminase small subunit [Clostridium sp. CAG:58]